MDYCFLCGSKKSHIIHKGVRGNPSIDVLKCESCGLVRLSEFIRDSEEYYESSKMRNGDAESDIFDIRRAADKDDFRRYSFISSMIENKNYLDFGCGAGGVLRYSQNKAKYICGIELETKMLDALNSEGIKCFGSISQLKEEINKPFDVISLFHVLEHLKKPLDILNELSNLLTDDGCFVIEVPNSDDALLSLYKCNEFADFTYWESHLYLYNNFTFARLIEKAGLRIRFLTQIQRYPLSNTLFWLSNGKPGGHKKWSALSNNILDKEYENALAKLGIADTILAIVEK